MSNERSPKIGEPVLVYDDGDYVSESIVNTGEDTGTGTFIVDTENYNDVEVEWNEASNAWQDVNEDDEEEDEE